MGVSIFSHALTAADVLRGKPDPEGFLKAAARLGVSADRCLVVEDSVQGIRAAQAAGGRCLALTTTFPRETLAQEWPDWLIQDLRSVPAELVPVACM
jgi:beta-phosphoglucomutase-like phosphatase (HAD superfamily)